MHKFESFTHPSKKILPVLALLLLASCGGGGGGETPELTPDCTACGAASNTVYSGSGVGIWTYKNTQSSAVSLPVSISGLSGKDVTIVYTNQGDTAVDMPSIALAPAIQMPRISNNTLNNQYIGDPAPASIIAQREAFARSFKGKVAPAKLMQGQMYAAPATAWVVGDTRSITTYSDETTTISLKKTVTTQDGTSVNIWIDDNEFGAGKVSMSTLDTFASKFASGDNSIYTQVTTLLGKPWGAHGYPTTLIPANQSINIAFYNGKGGGWGGFFYACDESTGCSGSNQWLSFYINTENIYDSNSWLDLSVSYHMSFLAHEFTHMVHQYQRAILLGKPFADWLNELAAMSMEDLLATKMSAIDISMIRDQNFSYWLNAGNFNCQQDVWLGLDIIDGCDSYAVNGALGAFLNRQYGVAYYKALFASSETDPMKILDGAIKSAGGTGYQDALRRWGGSIALLPTATTPAGHGYPARTDGAYSLVGFNGPDFKSIRKMPTTVPASLAPHAHFPVVRSNISGTFTENLTVPAGTSVTVVIQ